jgi:cell wall assembly regulator SMI1
MALETMEDTEAPVSEAEVAQVESELGVRLPDQYREFLLKYNGGSPQPPAFRYGTGPYTDSLVQIFNCIRPGDYTDLRKQAQVFKGRVPDDMLPIAADPFGNIIAIGVKGDATGKVFFWDHETSDVHLVALTFEMFLDSLEPEP